MHDLVEDTKELIEDERQLLEQDNVSLSNIHPIEDVKSERVLLKSHETGYIQYINYNGLKNCAKDLGITINVHCSIGDYVYKGTELIELHFVKEEKEIDLHQYIVVSNARRELYDIQFSINKIVDIALRALSPGINDPNTAIECINNLSAIIIQHNQVSGEYILLNEEDKTYVVYKRLSQRELLDIVFLQIVHYGQGDQMVMQSVYNALEAIRKHSYVSENVVTEFIKSQDQLMHKENGDH